MLEYISACIMRSEVCHANEVVSRERVTKRERKGHRQREEREKGPERERERKNYKGSSFEITHIMKKTQKYGLNQLALATFVC